MGIDTIVRLPPNVRVRDVASVIGKLLGLESRLEPLAGARDGLVAYVPGTHVRPAGNSVTSAFLSIEVPGGEDRTVYYSFEGRGGTRTILLASNPANISLASGIVDFFGGEVDFADNDGPSSDHFVPARTDAENCPEDGPEWDAFQLRVHALRAIRA